MVNAFLTANESGKKCVHQYSTRGDCDGEPKNNDFKVINMVAGSDDTSDGYS